MNGSNDRFPWPLFVMVVGITLAVTAGVDKYLERKEAAAHAAAQLAVHVPDYTQTGASKAPRKITIARAVTEAAPADALYAWSDDAFSCTRFESTEQWQRASNERLANIPGAYAQMVSSDQGITFIPQGDGTDLMVKTFFHRGLESCRAGAAEEKAITKSKIAESEAYAAAHPNETLADTSPAEPNVYSIPESAKDAGPWYMALGFGAGCQRIGTTPELFAYDLRADGQSVALSELTKNGNTLILAKLDNGIVMFAKDMEVCEHMDRGIAVLLERRARGLPE